jgi:hypothetical protein
MGKLIKVTIAPDGTTKLEAIGYTGIECLKDTRVLEEALGATGKRSPKPEQFAQLVKKVHQ